MSFNQLQLRELAGYNQARQVLIRGGYDLELSNTNSLVMALINIVRTIASTGIQLVFL